MTGVAASTVSIMVVKNWGAATSSGTGSSTISRDDGAVLVVGPVDQQQGGSGVAVEVAGAQPAQLADHVDGAFKRGGFVAR